MFSIFLGCVLFAVLVTCFSLKARVSCFEKAASYFASLGQIGAAGAGQGVVWGALRVLWWSLAMPILRSS